MSWLTRVFSRRSLETDLEKELRFHFENQVTDKIRSGISVVEARRLTRLEFGGIDQIKEDCRESRGTMWLESLPGRPLRAATTWKITGLHLRRPPLPHPGHRRQHRHLYAAQRDSAAPAAGPEPR